MLRALVTLALVAAAQVPQCCRAAADGGGTLPVHGRVILPEGIPGLKQDTEVWLELAGGRRLVAFALRDGSFSFAAVPVGVHSLGVEHGQLLYPTLRLDVGAARKGRVAATVVDVVGASPIPHPLLLRPIAGLEWFERRQPFSLMGFLKTPYGMMAGFMVFSLFILPRLKIDPEELAEMRSGGDAESTQARITGSQGRRRD